MAEDGLARGNGVGDLVPRPDPSDRTTQLVDAATAALREIIEARLDAMDKATVLLDTQRAGEIKHLQELHDEKFTSIDRSLADRDKTIDQQFTDSYTGMTLRFSERDVRGERESRDNKIAVDAAFAAAKEAVAEQNKSSALAISKSEAATTKQIDAQAVATDSKFKATDDKIDDLKARLDRGEGSDRGSRATWDGILPVVSILIALTVAVVLIIHG